MRDQIRLPRGRAIALEDAPRRQRQPQEKLARLIASATTIFGAEGYAHARIQDVCAAAGVSVGTFYDHFENKADLMLHVAEQAIEALSFPPTAGLPELEQHVAWLETAPTAGVARAWSEAIRIDPALRQANARMRGVTHARYTQWVRDARGRRRAHPALDDELTASAVIALLREAVTGTYQPSADRVRDMARAIWFLVYAE
jgi:AcrR family transcriptional regulator